MKFLVCIDTETKHTEQSTNTEKVQEASCAIALNHQNFHQNFPVSGSDVNLPVRFTLKLGRKIPVMEIKSQLQITSLF